MGLEKIGELKEKKKLTTEELSKLSGVPKGTLDKILSGITKDPKLGTLKAIARVFECSLDDFDDENNKINNHCSREEISYYIDARNTRILKKISLLPESAKDDIESILDVFCKKYENQEERDKVPSKNASKTQNEIKVLNSKNNIDNKKMIL